MPKLNSNQTLKVIILITFLVFGIGAVFYHYIEGLRWLDAFYFSTITLTTIGYGDISPNTDPGKIFTMFYALTGIGIIGAVINTLSQRRAERVQARRENRQSSKTN